jgi:hypothetical protein
MSRKRLVREYTPDFAAGNYKPGEAKMGRHGGKGLQSSGLGRIGYDADSELTSHGEQWPRKHKETAAMCDVEESGVETKSQGGHASSVGKPTDGHTKNVGHDWPKKPKNRGGMTAMKGSRYSDGGVLGQSSSEVSESWTPTKISKLLGEGYSIQSLFDKYAKGREWVCLESFCRYCEASGCQCQLDETSLETLMDRNQDFTFYEGADSDGRYWTPLNEAVGHYGHDHDDFEDDYEGDDEFEDGDEMGMDSEMGMDDEMGMDGEMGMGMGMDKVAAFAEKYDIPVEELEDLIDSCMGDQSDQDEPFSEFGDEDGEMGDDEMDMDGEMDDYSDDEDIEESWSESSMGESSMDESMCDSVDESMDESWSEGWSEEEDSECCENCKCTPCECMSESVKRRRAIKESRRRRSR